jgi:hypothetical protein
MGLPKRPVAFHADAVMKAIELHSGEGAIIGFCRSRACARQSEMATASKGKVIHWKSVNTNPFIGTNQQGQESVTPFFVTDLQTSALP